MSSPFRLLVAVAALALAAAAAVDGWRTFPYLLRMDFYHMWGVPLAHDTLAANPYAQVREYGDLLNEVTVRSASPLLKRANNARRVIEPTGTPFYYAVFGVLPRDFDAAAAVFCIAQYAALFAAMVLLARLNGGSAWLGVALAGVVALDFNPFAQDVKYGNVNAFQLLWIAGLMGLSAYRARLPPFAFRDAFPALLAALAMFKPNTLWIVALLAFHYVAVAGRGAILRGFLAGAIAAAVCAGVGAAYFDGPAAWHDWLHYTQGMNGGRLLYNVGEGNHAVVKLLAEASPRLGVMASELLLTALLLAAFSFALVKGRSDAPPRARVTGLLGDVQFAASCGVVLMLATSPLIWPHYDVLALVPIAWLLAGHAGRFGIACAALACAALASPVIALLVSDHFAWVRIMTLFCWVPLAAGMIAAGAIAANQGARVKIP
ncbi:MAG TPA: glycosyltransferase 87 family protein [Usitatibacter sp.]|nr:glycosyltransferase 87 family protein [Usitatibacter sp.]